MLDDDSPLHVRLLVGIRDKHRLTQGELGALLGVSAHTIERWERQRTQPRSAWMAAFRELLHADDVV